MFRANMVMSQVRHPFATLHSRMNKQNCRNSVKNNCLFVVMNIMRQLAKLFGIPVNRPNWYFGMQFYQLGILKLERASLVDMLGSLVGATLGLSVFARSVSQTVSFLNFLHDHLCSRQYIWVLANQSNMNEKSGRELQ